jgi:chromosomal replication initiation ATPase DnaA
MVQAADDRLKAERAGEHRHRETTALIRTICRRENISVEELRAGSRRKRVAAVRARLAVHLVTRLGLPLADLARQLGVSTSGIAKAVGRAEK